MDIKDELAYELYFRYQNLSKEEGDFYLDVLRRCKEVSDSEYGPNGSYDIVEMLIARDEQGVIFNGSMSNGTENRFIHGSIANKLVKTYVDLNVERLCDVPEREFNVLEVFNFKHSEVKRDTYYRDGRYFEATFKPFVKEEMEAYKLTKVYRKGNN